MAQQENLDSRLLAGNTLAGPAQESLAAKSLRQGKAGGGGEGGEGGEEGGRQSFRQRIMAARQALNLKERAKEKIKEKVTAPAREGTNWLLRWAWTTLIPSWGLTLIYINIHVFLRMVLGEKLFCKLGQEWLPKQITAVAGEAGDMGGKTIGIVEVMALLLLDLVALFIVLGALTIIAMIVTWMTDPLGALKAIWDLGWGGVKAFYQLFIRLF